MIKNKKLSTVMLVAAFLAVGALSLSALVYPDSYYNYRSWTWSYNAPSTTSYNCLGYATCSMTWEWPWGANLPTSSQVDTYLYSKGYSSSGSIEKIISYGTCSAINHFSKVTGSNLCRAKWGALERFDHGNWDPYYARSCDGCYGPKVKIYY